MTVVDEPIVPVVSEPLVRPFAAAAPELFEKGWSPLPLEPGKKKTPPEGFTGKDGRDATEAEVAAWCREQPNGNVGVRLPRGVIGIDVDAYGSKPGAATLADLEDKLGALPSTWTSTARSDGVSGIRFFRIPAEVKLQERNKDAGSKLAGIEILQHHHRYAVVSPSINPDTGTTYRWVSPDGELMDEPPGTAELPDLPAAWLEELRADKPKERPPAPPRLSESSLNQRGIDEVVRQFDADLPAGRHDAALLATARLARLQERGWPGVEEARDEIHRCFIQAVTGDGSRSLAEAEAEWTRMVDGAKEEVERTPATTPMYEELTTRQRIRLGRGFGQGHLSTAGDSGPMRSPTSTAWPPRAASGQLRICPTRSSSRGRCFSTSIRQPGPSASLVMRFLGRCSPGWRTSLRPKSWCRTSSAPLSPSTS